MGLPETETRLDFKLSGATCKQPKWKKYTYEISEKDKKLLQN